MASCAGSVMPSVAAPSIVEARAARVSPFFIPDRSSSFSTTPAFIPGANRANTDAGNTESNAAETDPARAAAPGSNVPVSLYMFWKISGVLRA